MDEYNEYYEKFKDLTAEELKKEVNRLLKSTWPDLHPEKSDNEKEVMQEESIKIILAFNKIKDGVSDELNDFSKELDPLIRKLNDLGKRIEHIEYKFASRGLKSLSYEEWLKQQTMVKKLIGNLTPEYIKSLHNRYIKWIEKRNYKEKYEFYDWYCKIGSIEIQEEKYIKWICGEYNDQNKKKLLNQYHKYLISYTLGLHRDKKKLTFLEWLIETYSKKYYSYTKTLK